LQLYAHATFTADPSSALSGTGTPSALRVFDALLATTEEAGGDRA
jgi:hypothetical protein